MNNLIILSIALALVIASFYLVQKWRLTNLNFFLFSVMFFLFLLNSAAYLGAHYFTGDGIDESVEFHLKYGLEGAGFWEYRTIIGLTLTLIFGGVLVLFWLYKRQKGKIRKQAKPRQSIVALVLMFLAIVINPATADFLALASFSKKPASFEEYQKFFHDPRIREIKNKVRNLVFIYAESLERTYFDENIFPGLIKELKKIESISTSFKGIEQVVGTGWTIGGMVASQCGIPLFTPSHGNSMSGMDSFLGDANCLSDLLSDQNYEFVYRGGASLDFAGKGKFYKSHRFNDIKGKAELVVDLKDDSYQSAWGLFDDSLFDIAFNDFERLSQNEDKFGLFLLTLDTHHPYGHPSASCEGEKYEDGENPILNAVVCSDIVISKFINKIIDSPYAKDVVIVLVSDHLAMGNTASNLLDQGKRRDLFMIIDPLNMEGRSIDKRGSMLDIGATVLPVMGYQADVGMGRNLLGNVPSLTTQIASIDEKLLDWKGHFADFWNFPRIREQIEVSETQLKIDERSFQIPVLIELDEKLRTTLRFQFYGSREHKTLVEHIQSFEPDIPFLWIDHCEMITSHIGIENLEPGICIAFGKSNNPSLKMAAVKRYASFSVEEIKSHTGMLN